MKTSFGPQKLMFPCPVTLIVTGTIEKANIVTVAWVSLLSSKPPTIGVSIGQNGLSGKEIRKNGNFTINIASADIIEEADFCGIVSGKDYDKFEYAGLTKMPSNKILSPIIKECPYNIECKLIDAQIIGTTNHFVAEIVDTHIDTDKLNDINIFNSFSIEDINPLVYIGGAREYRAIGRKLGDAYSIGNNIEKKK
jgi:flavin reductase (DIM6/NTAB) family NADH-FMN oxidoreductase RutF